VADHLRQELAPGMTYRQLDYWTRIGLLFPENGPTPGSGHGRQWSEAELWIARRMGELRLEGYELPAAARVARTAYETARGIPCGTGWPR
jgi:DNA-binding transcriptional MerR regulator